MKLLIVLISLIFINTKIFASEKECADISFYDNQNTKINFIEIIPEDYRRFKLTKFKNLVSLEDNLANNLYFSKKKKFKSLIILNFSNKKKCELNAKIRVHGDGRDHYKLIDGDVVASLDVELLDGNLFNSVKFKLFIPEAEGGNSEIFNSYLFKELGFLSPETRNLDVKIGERQIKYLFQEKLAKEMIEKNYRREGPILEADEENTFGLMRIQNKKWTKGNIKIGSEILGTINEEMMAIKNNFFLNSQKKIKSNSLINYSKLANNNTLHHKSISDFVLLGLATGSSHMFSFNDMRFYYDTMYGSFFPIYYDAEPNLDYEKLSFPENISNYIDLDIKNIKSKLNNLDIKKLKNNLQKFGLRENEKQIEKRIDIIKKNLKLIGKKKTIKVHPDSYDFQNLEKYFRKKNIYIVYEDENNNFLTCKFIKKNCSYQQYSEYDKINLIRQRHKKEFKISDKPQYTFFGLTKNSKKNSIRGFYKWTKKKIENDIFLYSLNTKNKIRIQNKEIEINFLNKFSRVLILGDDKVFENWTININGEKQFYGKNNLINTKTNLTGCLTFLDINVKNININTNNLHCEDSVNFIRSNGTVKNVNISNSFSDALDIDFSDLTLENVNIENSKNDCVDLSYGNYKITNLVTKNCGDKGLSVGEKSNVVVNEFYSSNSEFGAVSKDSSVTKINKARISNNKYCIAAYNKKQEFAGSIIKIKDADCSGFVEKFFKDDFSKIIIN